MKKLVFLFTAVLFSQDVFAQLNAGNVKLRAVNPEFTKYLELKKAGQWPQKTASGHTLGYIPSPIDRSHLKGVKVPLPDKLKAVQYPASYDLRTLGKVSSVKDQGSCNSCWAFAVLASAESRLLTRESWDFSENNMKNTAGFEVDHCYGGNFQMATAYLARWGGPVTEASDPYSATYDVSPSGLSPQKHLQEALFLPERTGPTDNDWIKWALTNYGAVTTAMRWQDGYFRSGGGACAYNYNGAYSANHAVAIVGWDDNYPSSNFFPQPVGNGAFIVKNSWGASWGCDGFFYISYYDTMLGDSYIPNVIEPAANYNHIYQYDPLGWVASYSIGSTTIWSANVFTSVSTPDEPLSAVGFYTDSAGMSYEVRIYTGVSSEPTSGTLAVTASGNFDLPGFHRVVLPSPVSIDNGSKFSVVVKLTSPVNPAYTAVEVPASGYSGEATANVGESYISADGSNWIDLTTVTILVPVTSQHNTNLCIKAYTSKVEASTADNIRVYPSPAKMAEVGYITFDRIPAEGNARIIIRSISGEVKILTDGDGIEYEPSSTLSKIGRWDGKNKDGQKVASGVYIYKITAGSYIKTGKVGIFW